jgi:excisionase family DNA binding protein
MMNTREAAKKLGVSPAKVRRLIAQGKLNSTKVLKQVGSAKKRVHDIAESDLAAYQDGKAGGRSVESGGSEDSTDSGGENEHPVGGDSAADRVRQHEKSPVIPLAAGALTLLLIAIAALRPSSRTDKRSQVRETPAGKGGSGHGGISLPGMP